MAVSRITKSSILQGFPKSRSLLAGNAYYVPPSFESIATANGTGSSASVTFSSIPGTFKHLQIRTLANDALGSQINMIFNADTGSNYARHRLYGDGTTVAASGTATTTNMFNMAFATGTANIYGSSIIDIVDYASTTKYKTARSLMGWDLNGSGNLYLTSGLWMNTAAITSITLTASGTLTTASTFALYGIKG